MCRRLEQAGGAESRRPRSHFRWAAQRGGLGGQHPYAREQRRDCGLGELRVAYPHRDGDAVGREKCHVRPVRQAAPGPLLGRGAKVPPASGVELQGNTQLAVCPKEPFSGGVAARFVVIVRAEPCPRAALRCECDWERITTGRDLVFRRQVAIQPAKLSYLPKHIPGPVSHRAWRGPQKVAANDGDRTLRQVEKPDDDGLTDCHGFRVRELYIDVALLAPCERSGDRAQDRDQERYARDDPTYPSPSATPLPSVVLRSSLGIGNGMRRRIVVACSGRGKLTVAPTLVLMISSGDERCPAGAFGPI
jgi:hypothetical protein